MLKPAYRLNKDDKTMASLTPITREEKETIAVPRPVPVIPFKKEAIKAMPIRAIVLLI